MTICIENTVTCMSECTRGFVLVTGFTGHLQLAAASTSNMNLQSAVHYGTHFILIFPVTCEFTIPPATASNAERSPSSEFRNCPRDSHSDSRLTATHLLRHSRRLCLHNSPCRITLPVHNFSARIAEKIPFLCGVQLPLPSSVR
jgi:hypothetical protein